MSFFHVSIFFKKLLSQKEPKYIYSGISRCRYTWENVPTFLSNEKKSRRNNNLRLVRKTINLARCQWNTEGFIKKSIIKTLMLIVEELDGYAWPLTCLILSLRSFHFPSVTFVVYTINAPNFRDSYKSTIE